MSPKSKSRAPDPAAAVLTAPASLERGHPARMPPLAGARRLGKWRRGLPRAGPSVLDSGMEPALSHRRGPVRNDVFSKPLRRGWCARHRIPYPSFRTAACLRTFESGVDRSEATGTVPESKPTPCSKQTSVPPECRFGPPSAAAHSALVGAATANQQAPLRRRFARRGRAAFPIFRVPEPVRLDPRQRVGGCAPGKQVRHDAS
jgi:hypothetical protein